MKPVPLIQAPTMWQMFKSVMAAFLGVQSEHNRRRDFAGGNMKAYIVIGIIATILLVLGLISVVNLVLP